MRNLTAFFLFFLCFSIFSFSSKAQLRLPGLSNPDVRQALEKVIADYPNGFSTLKGEVLANNPQTVEYSSRLQFKTAEWNSITEHSGKTPVYSWQALMLSNEEFGVAEKKYKSLFKELKNVSLTLNRDYSYGLDGTFEAPSEAKKFASSVFHLTPNATYLPNVKVELSLQYELLEWKIYLTVFQKERNDNEQGKTKE